MNSPLHYWRGIDRNDRYMLLSSIVVPLAFWWFYVGRKKYSTKGMK